jgi:hypothetical protein
VVHVLTGAKNPSAKLMYFIKTERGRLQEEGAASAPADPPRITARGAGGGRSTRRRSASPERDEGEDFPAEGDAEYDDRGEDGYEDEAPPYGASYGQQQPLWSGDGEEEEAGGDDAGAGVAADSYEPQDIAKDAPQTQIPTASQRGAAAAAGTTNTTASSGGGAEDDDSDDALLRELREMKSAESEAEEKIRSAAQHCTQAWEEAKQLWDTGPQIESISANLAVQEEEILQKVRSVLSTQSTWSQVWPARSA